MTIYKGETGLQVTTGGHLINCPQSPCSLCGSDRSPGYITLTLAGMYPTLDTNCHDDYSAGSKISYKWLTYPPDPNGSYVLTQTADPCVWEYSILYYDGEYPDPDDGYLFSRYNGWGCTGTRTSGYWVGGFMAQVHISGNLYGEKSVVVYSGFTGDFPTAVGYWQEETAVRPCIQTGPFDNTQQSPDVWYPWIGGTASIQWGT
jgi:hypothetical protein